MTQQKSDISMIRRYGIFTLVVIFFYMSAYVYVYADDVPITLENEPIQPIELPKDLDPAKIDLGRKIFNDTKLSKNDTMSCATCHQVGQGGTVRLIHAPPGVSGKSVPLNVPTFFGSALNFAQFWDGRAATLEDQVDGPTSGADEMGSSWPEIIAKLKVIPEYKTSFQKIYGTLPDQKSVKNAIAVFERSQTPVDSPFDLYLKGDNRAIGMEAREGYALFKNLGCSSCHQGQNVGGNMFQKFGIIEDYFHDRGHVIDKDYGRYNVTHIEEDRYVFKVPSLRNIDQTAPYFHDGSAGTLEKAVDTMAKYQLGRTLSEDERSKLVAFLKSLTGKIATPSSPEDAHE
jgi:cytochrome c peroxidase